MEIAKKLYRLIILDIIKAKHFPRQTRRSSHVWLQKLVNLELNLSSVSENSFQIQPQIYLNYRALSKLSMDLKVMPRSQKGHKFILCIIDEMTNYLITVPIYHSRSEEVGEALIQHVISKYCAPNCIIMDQNSAFMSTLMNYLFRKLNINIKTVTPYNHQSLQAEYGIKSLSRILTKHLTGQGQMWHRYLPLATFAHNTFNSPNLANHSPYKLVFGEKAKIITRIRDRSRHKGIRNI